MSVTQPSQVVATHEPAAAVAYVPPLINDREIATLWEVARGLAASQIFKDSNQAAQAFGKLIIGREWGFTPAQSMMLYVMEGKIEVPYPLFAHIIRQRPGYDFYVEWREDLGEGKTRWVRADATGDEGESGDYEITGCRITATVDMFDGEGPQPRARSVWTKRDSERAELERDRGSKKSNHLLYPRNMYLARAMSNLVKFYIPEVLNGLPVYAEGEIPRELDVSGGGGDGLENEWNVGEGELDLRAEDVERIEAVIKRAERVGHAGLASRASAKIKLSGRRDLVPRWLEKANIALDALDPAGATPPDAEVVDDPAKPSGADPVALRTAAALVKDVLRVVVIPALRVRRIEHLACGATWDAPMDDEGTACAGAGPNEVIEGEVLECVACGEPARVATVQVDMSPPPDPEELERQALAKADESDAVADSDPDRAAELSAEAADLHDRATQLRGGPQADPLPGLDA